MQKFSVRALRLCLDVTHPSGSDLEALHEVSIVLVSDNRMAALHKKFMNVDGPTDVLTFQHGEIFVSVETAQRNAVQFQATDEEEIRLYIVHGLLHLRGINDIVRRDAHRMNSMQRRILAAAAAA